jgi:outer membrane protein TolC
LWAVAQYQLQSQQDNLKIWDYGFPRTSFAGVRLSIPIYSGGRAKYKTAQSQFDMQQNDLAIAELKNGIQTELISLSANLQEAYNQWKIQQQNVDAAQINYTMMNDRYKNGLSNRLELTDAELALTKAKLDNLQSIYLIKLSEVQLQKAMGILRL